MVSLLFNLIVNGCAGTDFRVPLPDKVFLLSFLRSFVKFLNQSIYFRYYLELIGSVLGVDC